MSLFSIDELKTLVEQSQAPCVSLFMPTYKAGSEVTQNPIRFKNLMRQAANQLEQYGLRPTEAQDFLKPAMDLDREEFWQQQDQGLAIFLAEGFLQYYSVPLDLNELVVANDRFHLKPLLSLMADDGKFFVLGLSQKQVRFFEGTRYGIREIELEGVPTNLDEALKYDPTAKDGQFRISTSKGGTNNSFQHAGSFHGQGSPDRDEQQKDVLQFLHLVDQGIHKYLHDQHAPLILAGVEPLLPLYQEANDYPYLVNEIIHTENMGVVKAQDLHKAAWNLAEPYYAQHKQQAIEHYHELAGTGKASTDLQEAVSAAYYGRVDQLFVAVGIQQWGNFDPQNNELQVHPQPEPGDEDLLNSAAVQTILNGGTVYAVEPGSVPDAAPLAAIFRY